MNLIIAGPRDLFVTTEFIEALIVHFKLDPKIVLYGGATGIDVCGKTWAIHTGREFIPCLAKWDDLTVPGAIIRTRPDGSQYNAAAGPMRNKVMAEKGDALLLIWQGKSKGSKSMREEMGKLRKPVFETIVRRGQNGQ